MTTGDKVLYKYVVRSSSSHFSWEDRIPDRELKVAGPSSIVNDGHFNQLSRAATFSALQRPKGAASEPASRPIKPGGSIASFGGTGAGGQMRAGTGSGEAGAALKVQAMRHEQLLDRVAELQRRHAVEKAEIERLSGSMKSGTMDAAGTDPKEAAEAFGKVQEKLAALAQKRAAVHEQARQSSDALAQVKKTASEMEAQKQRVANELQREVERKAQLREAVQQTRGALEHARGSAQRIARVTQQNAETKEELAARLRQQVEELAARHAEQQKVLEGARTAREKVDQEEASLQSELLALHESGIKEEQEVQRGLLEIHETHETIASLEAVRKGGAAGAEAEREVASLQKQLEERQASVAEEERQMLASKTEKERIELEIKTLEADTERVRGEVEILRQREAVEQAEEAAAHEAEELAEAQAKEEPPAPPAPYFSWLQTAQSASQRLSMLGVAKLEQEEEARRVTCRMQQLRCDAARARMRHVQSMGGMLHELQRKRDQLSQSLQLAGDHKKLMWARIRELELHVDHAHESAQCDAEQMSKWQELQAVKRSLANATIALQSKHQHLDVKIQAHHEAIARLESELNATQEQAEQLESLVQQGRPPTESEIQELVAYISTLETDRDALVQELAAKVRLRGLRGGGTDTRALGLRATQLHPHQCGAGRTPSRVCVCVSLAQVSGARAPVRG